LFLLKFRSLDRTTASKEKRFSEELLSFEKRFFFAHFPRITRFARARVRSGPQFGVLG
jgi:hypothetical protein